MMSRACCLSITFWLISFVVSSAGPAKVVCLGDSITKRGYPQIVAAKLGVEVINAGVAGNSSSRGLGRLEKEVLLLKPDVVVVFFGTNDLRVDAEKVYVPTGKYEKNLKTIITRCRKQGSKVVLCTLPPINEAAFFTRHEKAIYAEHGGLEALITSYADTARRVAVEEKVSLVDLNQLLVEEPTWMHKDGVHPSPEGNAIIAKHIAIAVKPLLPVREDK